MSKQSSLLTQGSQSGRSLVSVEFCGNGIAIIRLQDHEHENRLSASLTESLLESFKQVQETDQCKVVVLAGLDKHFILDDEAHNNQDLQLQTTIVEFDLPVIAAMAGDASGTGWLLGLCCDGVVYADEGSYCYSCMNDGYVPGGGATLVFPEKLDNYLAREILFTGRSYSGAQLRLMSACTSVARVKVEETALEMAGKWTSFPLNGLHQLKSQLSQQLRAGLKKSDQEEKHIARQLQQVSHATTPEKPRGLWVAKKVESGSETVQVEACENGVVVVKMCDRQSENTFSESLADGLLAAFEHIKNNADYKAVVLTGYGDCFACGGNREDLSAVQGGEVKFTDEKIHALTLACDIPVIAAMQGHATGAGWVLGMFCDFTVFGKESTYTSHYIRHGLAPGTGASLVFPERFGDDLAWEILFTAKEYKGAEFEERGTSMPVVPRDTVVDYAMEIANRLALSSRLALVLLKIQLGRDLRDRLCHAFQQEMTIHEKHEKTVVDTVHVSESISSGSAEFPEDFAKKETAENITADEIPPMAVLQNTPPALRVEPVSKITGEARSDRILSGKTSLQSDDEKVQGHDDTRSAVSPPAIAIIGMAGQFPQSKNLAEFWENLAGGQNCISEIPKHRWDMSYFFDPDPDAPGKTYCERMGVLDDVDRFDPLFFNISPAEAKFIDPRQRLFLQNCWSGMEDAGLSPSALSAGRGGVYVGCSVNDYAHEQTAQDLTGSATSILSARIARLLDLKGPCMSIDTACSSSLVAIAEACNSLVLGTSDVVFAGGVCVLPGPSLHIMTSKAGMLSRDNRCFVFDARANGFVPGEGVGVIILKRLSDAIRDGDSVAGVIRGWGVNQDGKAGDSAVPDVNSQIQLEKEVYQRFNINPESISLVEAHGAGTPSGDSVEVEALTRVFQTYTRKKSYCALGSVKSNIGHLMPAAGVSGVIKILLALKHKMLPPTINFETPNEQIVLQDSPFYINTALQDWQEVPGQARRAAVSSFGFGGTNAHLVIEEYLPEPRPRVEDADHPVFINKPVSPVFVLSAKNENRLEIYAKRMLDYVQTRENLNLADMTYTLQTGREAMDFRLAVLADSRQALLDGLQAFVKGETSALVMSGKADKHQKTATACHTDNDEKALLDSRIKKKDLAGVAKLWVAGLDVDWQKIYKSDKPRRISLPTYPFAGERYWHNPDDNNSSGEEIVCTENIIPQHAESGVTSPGNKTSKQVSPDQDIAIIGMSGKYPHANSLSEYWNNLCEGRDTTREMSVEHFDDRLLFSKEKGNAGSVYSGRGGFIDDIDKFDALFFNVPPHDACAMDPQERIFLENTWECLESAGYIGADWQDRPRNVSVFAGATFNHYQLVAEDAVRQRLLSPVNSHMFSIANHVSRFFNFTGPSLTVDTACSSSLYALHLACESIKRGEAEMAIAGGVNLSLHPEKYFTGCRRGGAASDGHYHAFGEEKDGYVPGEGVGTVLLKSCEQATEDGDRILAVIKGTGVSHDGKIQDCTASNPASRAKAIEAAFKQADINPDTISYIEAHGVGTPLGDAAEMTGLMDVFSKYTDKKQFCAIGSVKSGIGHGEAVAGIAQLTKTVLQMQHKTLVPSLLHSPLNDGIDFGKTAFFVQQEKSPWLQPVINDSPVPRRAGVSSFGAGGVNVHVIVEEYTSVKKEQPPPPSSADDVSPVVIPFSAHVQSQLSEQVCNFIHWLNDNGENCDIADIAYTLQCRRASFRFRLAFVVRDKQDLLTQLTHYVTQDQTAETEKMYYEADSDDPVNMDARSEYSGEGQRYLSALKEAQDMDMLARLWVCGTHIHWYDQEDNRHGRRCLSLPTYAFLKRRYWIRDIVSQGDEETGGVPVLKSVVPVHGVTNRVAAGKFSDSVINNDNTDITPVNSPFPEPVSELSETGREASFNRFLEEHIKSVLEIDPDDSLDANLGFSGMGMESMQTLFLRQRLEKELSLELPDTVLFDYPSINQLSGYLESIIARRQPEEKMPVPGDSPLPDSESPYQDDMQIDEIDELLSEGSIPEDIENLSDEEIVAELFGELES